MKITRKQTQKLILQEIKKERIKRQKYIEFCDFVLKENSFLFENRKYLTQKEINEGVLDTIMSFGGGFLGNLFPGFIGGIKQSIAGNILKSFNLNPSSPFGRILVNIFEELKLKDFSAMISDWSNDGCKRLIDTVLRALTDAVQEYLLERFLGVSKDADLSGIGITSRETFTGTVYTMFIKPIAEKIEAAICGIEMDELVGKLKGMASGGSGKGKIIDVQGEIVKDAPAQGAKLIDDTVSKQFNI